MSIIANITRKSRVVVKYANGTSSEVWADRESAERILASMEIPAHLGCTIETVDGKLCVSFANVDSIQIFHPKP